MSDERKYSAEEMKEILEIATRSSSTSSEPARGEEERFTLAEIREIAREVGIDAASVDRAAQSLTTAPPVSRSVGLTTFQLERRISRRLSVDEMKFLVQQADRFFGEQGAVRHRDHVLEWYAAKSRAFVGMVVDGDGTRIRAIIDRSQPLVLGTVFGGLVGVPFVSRLLVSGAGLPEVIVLAAVVMAVLGVVWGLTRAMATSKLDALLDLMESDLPSL